MAYFQAITRVWPRTPGTTDQMTRANISELKDHLSEFLRRVEQGDEVVITKRNVPFATIVPLPRRQVNQTRLGCLASSVVVSGDLTEPAVPASDWDMLEP